MTKTPVNRTLDVDVDRPNGTSRPYTFVALALLIVIAGVAALATMPVDIFPYIDIPIVSSSGSIPACRPTKWRSESSPILSESSLKRKRHRAHRIAILQRIWRRTRLSSIPTSRSTWPSHRSPQPANAVASAATRHLSRQHPEVRRLQRPRPAARSSSKTLREQEHF